MAGVKLADNWQRKKIQAAREYQKLASATVNELMVKSREGRRITLSDGTELLEFMSCGYLGLDQDPRIVAAASDSLDSCGVTLPTARTRMRVENFVTLEKLLNQIFCGGFSTVFSNTHVAVLGLIPLLSSGELPTYPIKENGPLFILDKFVHMSLQINRGLMEQLGEVVMVDFNDHEIVREHYVRAQANHQTPIAFVDTIGSMGGIAPVKYILELADEFDGYAYFDDAHGISVYGDKGCGYTLKTLDYYFHPRMVIVASLSKAFGAVASAIVVATEDDEKMIKRFSSTYMFCGPPPVSIINSAIASAKIHLSGEVNELQKKLADNIKLFDRLIDVDVINYNTDSPIRGVKIGYEFDAIKCTIELKRRGFAVTTAMYPTVAKGKSMLRIALSAAHKKSDIKALCENINDVVRKHVNKDRKTEKQGRLLSTGSY